MKSKNQIDKIREAVLYVLNKLEGGTDYIKLFKILYFAQQENLVNYGKVIINDSFHALKHGPVPSYTYKAFQIADGKIKGGNFAEFISVFKIIDKCVYPKRNANLDFLSGTDIESLNSAIEKYRDSDPYELSDLSHDEAWREAFNRAQDDPQKDFMTIIDIARAGNAPEEMVAYIREKERLKDDLSVWMTS